MERGRKERRDDRDRQRGVGRKERGTRETERKRRRVRKERRDEESGIKARGRE